MANILFNLSPVVLKLCLVHHQTVTTGNVEKSFQSPLWQDNQYLWRMRYLLILEQLDRNKNSLDAFIRKKGS